MSEIETGGIEEKIVSIRILPEKLIKRGITHDDVKSAIDANNLSIPTGDISLSDEVLPVRVSKELQSLDDVKNIQLFAQKVNPETGEPELETVKLSEIANVTYENENSSNFTRINGKPGVVGIIAEGGANVVSIVEQAEEVMDEVKSPKGYEIVTLRDQSIEIRIWYTLCCVRPCLELSWRL